ncbi:MAG TPA: 4-hydroxy-tetrahydrodipicolinate reductase [Elusimicrobia bacterium]|nr:4-hydroxy-tetrahydrodipicolinate reductase [Elusimicrobiota bacterium]
MDNGSLKVVVLGAAGRMGSEVRARLALSKNLAFFAGVDTSGGPDIKPPSDFPSLIKLADLAVDFSAPAASLEFARTCAGARKAVVIGVTGFSAAQMTELKTLSLNTAVFYSPNMSPAVNLTFAVAALMAGKLPDFDRCIIETHHAAKKDAPSGTALKYAERMEKACGSKTPISSVRAGDIVGEHTVLYAGPHERVELTHRAHSRAVFAAGALSAALWLYGQKPGFYDFLDLLGLKELELI